MAQEAAVADFADAAVEVVSPALTTVYQGRDDAAATELAPRLLDRSAPPASGVPGLPDSRCVQVSEARGAITRYRCTATTGQYAFTATSRDLTSAHQQIAAQYLLLTE